MTGEATVTGMLRASEARGLFVPESDPKRDAWFTRDIAGIAAARELTNVAPYLIEADATPNPGGWPAVGSFGSICPTTTCNTPSRGSASPPA